MLFDQLCAIVLCFVAALLTLFMAAGLTLLMVRIL
jgi:hypothetical protein